MRTKTWQIQIYLSEDGTRTRAEAVLRTDAGTELRRVGEAHRNPFDLDVPEIGDELAAARALDALTYALFDASVVDVEDNIHDTATFTL